MRTAFIGPVYDVTLVGNTEIYLFGGKKQHAQERIIPRNRLHNLTALIDRETLPVYHNLLKYNRLEVVNITDTHNMRPQRAVIGGNYSGAATNGVIAREVHRYASCAYRNNG